MKIRVFISFIAYLFVLSISLATSWIGGVELFTRDAGFMFFMSNFVAIGAAAIVWGYYDLL